MIWCIVTADQREVDEGDLDLFLASIEGQEVRVIAILREVSTDDVERYQSMPQVAEIGIVDRCGISAARNAGLKILMRKGVGIDDYVSFPDDDCRYSASFFDTFYTIVTTLNEPELILGTYGETVASVDEWRDARGADALLRASSVGVFVKWKILREEGFFNEGLGVGSGNVSYGEDNDMAFRLYRRSRSSIYAPSLRVWHLEDRVTTGRNHKGYLSVAALHLSHRVALGVLLRGVGSAVARDLMRLDSSFPELRAVGRAMNLRVLREAKAQGARTLSVQ